jgi:hypothetical protein
MMLPYHKEIPAEMRISTSLVIPIAYQRFRRRSGDMELPWCPICHSSHSPVGSTDQGWDAGRDHAIHLRWPSWPIPLPKTPAVATLSTKRRLPEAAILACKLGRVKHHLANAEQPHFQRKELKPRISNHHSRTAVTQNSHRHPRRTAWPIKCTQRPRLLCPR